MPVEYSKFFVVVFGIGVVFFGLICIIALTAVMGKVMTALVKNAPAPAPAAAAAAPAAKAPASAGIAPEIVAAITAALSEDPGVSSRGVNITSIKKL
ncbi:MAG: OadG family protein [Oscillospiraceae bacterium]|nr:OadG family protein [Oscillospiraceae bacterium]